MNTKKIRVTLLLWVGVLIIFPIAEGLTNETVFGYDNYSIAYLYVGDANRDFKVSIYTPIMNVTTINSMYIEVYLKPFYDSGSQTCSVSGDGNVSFTINKPNGTYYNITFSDYICSSAFRWVRKNISTTDFKQDGNYTVYFKAWQTSGGWNSIGLDSITTSTIHSYMDNSSYNINNDGNDSDYSWLQLSSNLMLRMGVNYSRYNSVILNVSISDTTPNVGSNIVVSVNTASNASNVKANGISLTNNSNRWVGDITALSGTRTVNISAINEEGFMLWDNTTSYIGYENDTTPKPAFCYRNVKVYDSNSTSNPSLLPYHWQWYVAYLYGIESPEQSWAGYGGNPNFYTVAEQKRIGIEQAKMMINYSVDREGHIYSQC